MNLIRLGEDVLRAASILSYATLDRDRQYLPQISDLMSRVKASPVGLFSTEADALVEIFREVHLRRWILPNL